MGNVTVNDGTLFIMSEDGKPLPLGNTIKVDMIENSIEDCAAGVQDIGQRCTSGEISFTLDYYNKKKFIEAFFLVLPIIIAVFMVDLH